MFLDEKPRSIGRVDRSAREKSRIFQSTLFAFALYYNSPAPLIMPASSLAARVSLPFALSKRAKAPVSRRSASVRASAALNHKGRTALTGILRVPQEKESEVDAMWRSHEVMMQKTHKVYDGELEDDFTDGPRLLEFYVSKAVEKTNPLDPGASIRRGMNNQKNIFRLVCTCSRKSAHSHSHSLVPMTPTSRPLTDALSPPIPVTSPSRPPPQRRPTAATSCTASTRSTSPPRASPSTCASAPSSGTSSRS